MGRFNLLPRLAAVALATVLAVVVGATALSQQAPTVDVTVDGAMAGDTIAVPGIGTFGTADASGSVTQTVPRSTAEQLVDMGNPFTVNGEAVTGEWDGDTYTIASPPPAGDGDDPSDNGEPAEEPTVMMVPEADRKPVSATLKISFPHDADATIKAGSSTKVVLTLKANSSALAALAKADAIGEPSFSCSYDNDALGNLLVTHGLFLQVGSDTDESAAPALRESDGVDCGATAGTVISDEGLKVVVPSGTDEGPDEMAMIIASIDVDITVSYDDADGQPWTYPVSKTVSGRQALTIDDVKDVDKITFALAAKQPDHIRIADSLNAGGSTEFELHIQNANGKPSQISEISSIVVSTDNGQVDYTGTEHEDIRDGLNTECGGPSPTCELEPLRDSLHPLKLTKGVSRLMFELSATERLGDANVKVSVTGRDGTVLSGAATVTVFGPAAKLTVTLDDGEGNLHHKQTADDRDEISFTVTAEDANGTAVGVPALAAVAKETTKGLEVTPDNEKALDEHKRSPLSRSLSVMPGAKGVATGDGMVTVKGGAAEGTGSFIVAGNASAVALELDNNAPSDDNDLVIATATVTDANGADVANGTLVHFASPDLTGDDDDVLHLITPATVMAKDGKAMATFIAVGPGEAVVTASSGGKTAHVRLESTVDAEAPAAPVDCSAVGIEGLSSTSGFATWSGDCDTSASALFAGLSARGSTAIHLWNGTAWVRYSVVDGSEVPGSSNFSVMGGDILYISN